MFSRNSKIFVNINVLKFSKILKVCMLIKSIKFWASKFRCQYWYSSIAILLKHLCGDIVVLLHILYMYVGVDSEIKCNYGISAGQ